MKQAFQISLIDYIKNNGDFLTLKKGEFLLKEGDIENHIYFIQDGAVHAYFLSEKEAHTIRLGYNGSIINSLASFLSHKPSDLFVETLRKTTFYRLSKEKFNAFVEQHNSTNPRAYISMMEQLIVQQIERELDLLIDAPKERLNRVLKRSPDVFQHIPLKYIASYLRMKPETLSRIRKS